MYVGRSLPRHAPVPKVVYLPYVSSWIATARVGGANYTEESTQTDLHNPHNSPLHIQRMLGRIHTAVDTDATQAEQRLTTVRIVDSTGFIVVKDATPFGHLVRHPDRAVTFNATMPPKSWMKVFLAQTYSTLGAGDTHRTYISLVGHREVRL
jgi:hypothetical protein